MNMEGPGMSLFQGAASIHINNSAQDRLEEQEELEDQKRRNEELKHKLANAFDDLLDDDEASSVNSSGNFGMDASQPNGGPHMQQIRHGLPPTYVESLTHLKEMQLSSESPKHCEIINNHNSPHLRHQKDEVKLAYSPYGAAGDGQNHYFKQDLRGHTNGLNNFEAKQEYMNNEQLKVMYEMRVKECQQLASQMEKLDSEIDSLRARLGAAVSDRDKAELSLQEAHHLLASSKHKMIELEQQVAALTAKLIESDQDKEQLKLELRSANMSLQEVQKKLHSVQVAHSHDTDALFREQQDRHREEMDRLQNDIIKAKKRLDDKENEIKQLEKRCKEAEKEKEEIIIEKGATINRLAGELEAAQSRLVSGEAARLKEKVLQLTNERNAAKEQVKELGSKLEITAHELCICRNKLSSNQAEFEKWRTTLQQILMESIPEGTYLGEPTSPGKLTALKEVLSRYRNQMAKLSTLQEEIEKRDKKIELHRKQESELRSKLEEHKGKEMHLQSRLAVLQNKLELLGTSSDGELLDSYKMQNERLQEELKQARDELKSLDLKYTELELEYEKFKCEKGSRASIVQEANADLLKELERYSGQLKDTLKENGELKSLYLQACSARDAMSRELNDIQTKINKERESFVTQEKEYIEKIENEKRQVEKLTSELASAKEDLEAANKRISELKKEFNDKQKEFTAKLNKYLETEQKAMRNREEKTPCTECRRHMKMASELQDQLAKAHARLTTQESSEVLMRELRAKAEFFQQYIMERFQKLSDQRSVGVNTEEVALHLLSSATATDEDDGVSKTDILKRENEIRSHFAEKLTKEIKAVEMEYEKKIQEATNKMAESVNYYKGWLVKKYNEIEMLKNFLLTERESFTKVLHAKDEELMEVTKERDELHAENRKMKQSFKEKLETIEMLEEALKKDKESVRERAKSKCVERELDKKLYVLEKKYEKVIEAHQTLQEKYKNNKKTIVTLKEYMSKKDAHVSNEMSRIQEEYRKIFVRLQIQLERMREERRALTPAQDDFTEKLNKLNEDFAKLSQGICRDHHINE